MLDIGLCQYYMLYVWPQQILGVFDYFESFGIDSFLKHGLPNNTVYGDATQNNTGTDQVFKNILN